MTSRILAATGLLVAIQIHALPAAAQQALPVRNGRPVVATVNGDPISLDEFAGQLGPTANRRRLRQGRATAAELELLERLVTIKLVAQEAARIGLDEAPEIQKQVEVTSREILREVLIERLVRNVQPDAAAVERVFRDLVREWKTTSLLFQDESAARRVRKEIADGAAFDDVAARAVAAKTARTDGDNEYHERKDYLPRIAQAIAALQVGQVSDVVALPAGFVVMKVTDIRYPENPEARAEARKQVLSQRQLAAVKAHEQALRRRRVVIHDAMVKGLDYEAAKAGLDALLKDTRVLVEIKGAAPITVADLTDYLRMQFFHGTDQARQRKEMNAKKMPALEAMIGRRVLNQEALALGIDRTNAYRDRVKGYRDSLIFDAFVQKVIVPDSRMKEDEVKTYYSRNPKEFSAPEMLKVRSLVFTGRTAAESAMRKLRAGTDYGWLASNADGLVPPGTPGALTFDGRPVTTDSMPDGLRKVLAGSKAGEFRMYGDPDGRFYVLAIQQVIASSPKPYGEVRQEIAKKLYGEKLKESVEEYGARLRAQSTVAAYLKKVQ
jgi:peptidyl-prolyl cis-trans isomerase C